MATIPEIQRALDGRRDRCLETLFRWLRQPSISAQNVGIAECAELVRETLEENGIPARLIPTAGHPVVYGERWVGDDANTMLIYGHYDVQPPEPLEAWISPPFEPTIRDGRVYARGAGDNKGQLLTHILAIKLLADLGELPRVNLKFLLEGEEESWSPSLPGFVEKHADLLRADVVFGADGPRHLSNRPVVWFGTRGSVTMELEARGANRDLHSGGFGGPIPNAAWKLVELLGTMRMPDGRVAIQDFYERVAPPTPVEREAAARIPFDPAAVKADLEISGFAGPPDLSYYDKIMFEPALNIVGLSAGYTGKGMKSAIPSRAVLKLECRLVANQEPDEVFAKVQRHVERYAPEVTIRKFGGTRPSKTSIELPVSRMVIGAVGDAFGVEPVVMPLLVASSPRYLFTGVLGLPTMSVSYGPPDENNHAPNENLTLEGFFSGIVTGATVIQRFAAMSREDLARPPK